MSAPRSSVVASARLTESSVSVSRSLACVRRARSAFSIARPTCAPTPSISRSSAGRNSRPARHQTTKSAPIGSPCALAEAKSTENGGSAPSHSMSNRGSSRGSPLATACPARQAGSRSGSRVSTMGRLMSRASRSFGTW